MFKGIILYAGVGGLCLPLPLGSTGVWGVDTCVGKCVSVESESVGVSVGMGLGMFVAVCGGGAFKGLCVGRGLGLVSVVCVSVCV